MKVLEKKSVFTHKRTLPRLWWLTVYKPSVHVYYAWGSLCNYEMSRPETHANYLMDENIWNCWIGVFVLSRQTEALKPDLFLRRAKVVHLQETFKLIEK